MDADGAILRQVFRQFRPTRHLEFGTWLGDGVLRVVEECDASVWTINLLAGETKPSGQWAYGTEEDDVSAGSSWREELRSAGKVWVRTDAFGIKVFSPQPAFREAVACPGVGHARKAHTAEVRSRYRIAQGQFARLAIEVDWFESFAVNEPSGVAGNGAR